MVAHATLLLKGKSLLHVPITAVGATPLPNLRIASASVSSPLTEGGPITFTRTLENAGAVDAGHNFTYFYLSTDGKFSIDDRYIGYCERTGALGPGLTSTCNVSGTFTLSPPATPGVHRAVLVADGDHEVTEGNEGDNVYAAPATVTVA